MHSVVSGHQVGLLGGPWFVLYKILGVYVWAQKKKMRPVYWLESNDADFHEIASFFYLDRSGTIKKLTWDTPSYGRSIGEVKVDQKLLDLYSTFFQEIPHTVHTAQVKDIVFDAYRINRSLLQANQTFFESIFSHWEKTCSFSSDVSMSWFHPDEEGFRKFSQDLLRKEIERTPVDSQCPVFMLRNGIRHALFKKKDFCLTRKGSKVDWRTEILLPSVHNRSVLQDHYLQARYYIAGPHEKEYLFSLLPLYQRYNIVPAQIKLRMSATVWDEEVKEKLSFLELSLDDLVSISRVDLWYRFQRKKLGYDFYSYKKNCMVFKDQLTTRLSISQEEKNRKKKTEKIIYQEIKHYLGKQRQMFKKKETDFFSTLTWASNFLFPAISSAQQRLQERTFTIVELFNRYGVQVIDNIYQNYAFENKKIFLPKKKSTKENTMKS